MQYRFLGKSGLQVSALSYGAWVTFDNQLDVSKAEEAMVAAYDAGVNFFDNAEAYAAGQAEVIMGKVLQRVKWPRDTYLVSSKVFFGAGGRKPNQRGLSRKHVVEACHAALERLQVDYLDLYFCHRPDYNTPLEETVRAMSDLITQGKVLYWGTSEWSAQQIMEAYSVARQFNLVLPLMEQPQYNMFHRERFEVEYAQLYTNIGLGTTIWSPLASGLLTGKYNDGIPEGSRLSLPQNDWLRKMLLEGDGPQKIEKVKALQKVADDLGTTMARLALAWCLKNPNVSTVITGSSKVEQIHDNMKAIEVADQLTDDVMEAIEGILDNKPKHPTRFL